MLMVMVVVDNNMDLPIHVLLMLNHIEICFHVMYANAVDYYLLHNSVNDNQQLMTNEDQLN